MSPPSRSASGPRRPRSASSRNWPTWFARPSRISSSSRPWKTIPVGLEFPEYEILLETGLPLWVSYRWCRDGPCDLREIGIEPARGPLQTDNGELFGRAAQEFERMGISAVLINCFPRELVSGTLPLLRRFTSLPLGIYPNLGSYLDPGGSSTRRRPRRRTPPKPSAGETRREPPSSGAAAGSDPNTSQLSPPCFASKATRSCKRSAAGMARTLARGLRIDQLPLQISTSALGLRIRVPRLARPGPFHRRGSKQIDGQSRTWRAKWRASPCFDAFPLQNCNWSPSSKPVRAWQPHAG
jgi:hypothetical protein